MTTVARPVLACTIESLYCHLCDDRCYDSEGNLACGYANFVVHRHDLSCFDENGNLWCPLPEIESHTHTESCYFIPEASAEVHTHTDDCFFMERGEMICTEHVNTDDCYTEVAALICSEDHEHGESCYEPRVELICGFDGDHQHTDACYEPIRILICDLSDEPAEEAETTEPLLICNKREIILHTHLPYVSADEPGCYDKYGSLICGKAQVTEHQHTDACFGTMEVPADTEILTCTNADEDHIHTALCYGVWELTCGMEEHTHSEACMPAEQEPVYLCGREVHAHSEECYDETGELTCGIEEHEHSGACLAAELTGEERARVYEMIALIGTLPTSAEAEEKLTAYEEAADEEGYEAYYAEVSGRVQAAYAKYDELGPELQAFVTNRDKLMELEWLLLPEEPQEETFSLTAQTESGIEVTVSGLAESLPCAVEEITLTADEITSDTAEMIRNQALEEEGLTAERNYLFDVTLWHDGQPVEPIGPVTLTFSGLPLNGMSGYQYDAKYDSDEGGVTCSPSNAGTNYWFGMSSSIKFYLPDASASGGSGYLNQSTKNSDMIFRFPEMTTSGYLSMAAWCLISAACTA